MECAPDTSGQSLFSGGSQSMGTSAGSWTAPASAAAWNSSGHAQSYGVAPNTHTVIDLANYTYSLVIVDENGANSVASSNNFFGMVLTFSAIGNSGPG